MHQSFDWFKTGLYALVTKEFRGGSGYMPDTPKIQLSDHCMIEICISVEKMELTE